MPFTRRQSRLASQSTPTPPVAPQTTATAAPPAPTQIPTATPKAKSAFAFLNAITHRAPKTPRAQSPVKPDDAEMHPQKAHRTSSTPYDEARWLGFFNMGAQTAPAKQATSAFHASGSSPTPVKVTPPTPASQATHRKISSPDFNFTFRRAPSVELSEDAKKIMAESRVEAAKIRAQMATLPSVPDTEPADSEQMILDRKIAKPKGKVGRFSDVHMSNFKKMDSIANHPSAWRADPSRLKPAANPALKRSPSKAELDRPTSSGDLKRAPSKSELPKPQTLTRSPSKTSLKIAEPNPFVSRTVAKPQGTTPKADELPQPSAKRVKHVKEDDAGTTRPAQSESPSATPRRQTPSLVRSKSGLLRPGFSSAMSPTKSSMARTQSFRDLKGASKQIPSLVRTTTSGNLRQPQPSNLPRSKSMKDLNAVQTPRSSTLPVTVTAPTPTPVKTAYLVDDSPVKCPELTSSPAPAATPKRIKSILRTPNRRYTRDPLKIAAGTHLATPPRKEELYPKVIATEPVVKHVDFTNSTKEKHAVKAASVEPEPVAYPPLPSSDTKRRTTMAAGQTMPGAFSSFTFRSEREMSFEPLETSTIRTVRSSDFGLPLAFQFTGVKDIATPKRKLGTVLEGAESEKENDPSEDVDEHRPAKKARVTSGSKSAPATPAAKSKLPRFGAGAKRASGLTAARLSLLAKPKRRA